jgi:hypothetical protein
MTKNEIEIAVLQEVKEDIESLLNAEVFEYIHRNMAINAKRGINMALHIVQVAIQDRGEDDAE